MCVSVKTFGVHVFCIEFLDQPNHLSHPLWDCISVFFSNGNTGLAKALTINLMDFNIYKDEATKLLALYFHRELYDMSPW